MAKQKLSDWFMTILAFIVSLAIGGAFIAGTFANVVILKYLPMMVHTIVGWALIITAVIVFGAKIYKAVK